MTDFIPAELTNIGELSRGGIVRAAAAIGVFDGVHRGHQKVLASLLAMAHKLAAAPVVITFYPHPRTLLSAHPPRLLYPPEVKARLLRDHGVAAVVTLPFTAAFARLDPAHFLAHSVFPGPVEVAGICVGKHWRFGARASGDAAFLERMAAEHGFRLAAVDELRRADGRLVSSTAIREAIAAGHLDDAQQMLGRRYSLFGTVEHGYRNATAKFHTPTANLKITAGILPPFGVYAAVARLYSGAAIPAAVNIGLAPTFQKQYGQIVPRVEAHLLNGFNASLYGKTIELELRGFVRPERRFADTDQLKQQIASDLAKIKNMR